MRVCGVLSLCESGSIERSHSLIFGSLSISRVSRRSIGGIVNLKSIAQQFSDPETARAFLESQRWPDGVVCPLCGLVGEAYKLKPKAESRTPVRPGVWKCAGCRKQFTVTVGTIFEDSHIPLNTWLMAIHLICSSKKGMSAHQLHRMLGITYKSAWFMAHRLRYALS